MYSRYKGFGRAATGALAAVREGTFLKFQTES